MGDSSEFLESSSITFEWTLKGLRNLFESSKGDAKSKVTKSLKFGGGRWQILFYANSGTGGATEGGGYLSLFLSCEPTLEEKENALNGRWVREGLYRFSFELRNITKQELLNVKEAHNHSFSYKTANWGWAQFARRDAVFYARNTVKIPDAFIVVCTISSMPEELKAPPAIPRLTVPKDLLDSVGSLLDDALYSDVEFVLPRRHGVPGNARKIYASKKLLSRADYFDTMFNSGFAETSDQTQVTLPTEETASLANDGASDTNSFHASFDDSDDEDEEVTEAGGTDTPRFDFEQVDERGGQANGTPPQSNEQPAAEPTTSPREGNEDREDEDGENNELRNVRPKLQHPSSPRASPERLGRYAGPAAPASGPPKLRVIVKDVAYSTYRAILYYLYTDSIRFAPLSSSFYASPQAPPPGGNLPTPNDSQANLGAPLRTAQSQGEPFAVYAATTRREWIAEWERNNPGRPPPCSAKAVYRLADKLDLRELKERAFQHITKSLTVENVPYEVFSTFSATFETVRKVEVKFFLDHWADIRGSDAMRNVWHQIRLGRHPGFEEVWPAIATNLEFRPLPSENAKPDQEQSSKAI